MLTIFSIRKIYIALPALLVFTVCPSLAQKQTECTQGSTCVSVNSGNDPLSAEQARQSKQQWDNSKSLRDKVNTRVEKEFDKLDSAIDAQSNCTKSTNINAYWEPYTERCLDRRTGQQILP